jgi:hypothetical protein
MLFFLLLPGPAAAVSIFSVSSFCRNCTVWGHPVLSVAWAGRL